MSFANRTGLFAIWATFCGQDDVGMNGASDLLFRRPRINLWTALQWELEMIKVYLMTTMGHPERPIPDDRAVSRTTDSVPSEAYHFKLCRQHAHSESRPCKPENREGWKIASYAVAHAVTVLHEAKQFILLILIVNTDISSWVAKRLLSHAVIISDPTAALGCKSHHWMNME